MKFADLPTETITVRVKQTNVPAKDLKEQSILGVEAHATRPGEFEVRLKESVVFVKPKKSEESNSLSRELSNGCAILAQFANPAKDESIELKIAFFSGECLEMDDIEIGVDEYVEERYSKLFSNKLSGEKIYSDLKRRCCYMYGESAYFLFYTGAAVDQDLRAEQKESTSDNDFVENNSPDNAQEPTDDIENSNEEESDASPDKATRQNSFCITGDGIRFVATEKQRTDGKTIYIATRLTKPKQSQDRALRLARGKLKFVDWTQAGQIQILTKSQMSALTSDDGSYLKKWDEFVAAEGELLLNQARKVGSLEFCDMTQNRDGSVSVRITHASDSALEMLADKDVESVDLINELPDYLTNAELTFAQFTGIIEKEAEDEAFFGKRRGEQKEPSPRFDVKHYDAVTRTLTLNTEVIPNSSGNLILSLAGQIAQIKRRLFARKAILEGRAANPQLGLLIEEKGEIAPTRAPSKIKPLTAFVAEKVFLNPPTDRQRDAIDVALNTPDVALIQGPPGTGKTTVIAAIIERLNELSDKAGANIKGSILLTGFQHDAVENMTDRLAINGLPVPKFGKRSGTDGDGFSRFERQLEEWCTQRARELHSKNPKLIEVKQETQIKNLCIQYLKAPTRTLALNIAQGIAKLGVSIVGEECCRRAARLAERLSLQEQLNDSASYPLLQPVRRLRHRPESFADDGAERVTDALEDLQDVLDDEEKKLLDKASLWRPEDGEPSFLKDIAKLKKKLLYRFTSPPVFRVEKQNDEILALAEDAVKKIRTAGLSVKDKKTAALAEFLAELESNPYGMIDTVADYAYAFAATCQQSVNKKMQQQKGIYVKDAAQEIQKIQYEYVIVDEAARVSPPDLMVAMAQGKRIILVGDHRQLPHIIDETVARQMENEETGENESDWLKKSMFQYFFSERLKALEENDRIQRRVTLDKQYRMHPMLGVFISRNFYERFDLSEKFGSGRPESDFVHNLSGTDNTPTIWLDVPVSKGKHQRSGTSWIRRAEATAIAHQLQTWMNSDEGKELSFGVISFYKAQAELVKKQLGKSAGDDKKLRIGTVDSFQGMEFDVVILSMVRTMPENWKSRDDSEEIQARRLFGHLCLYNRLNVSMSRQKKLLVVAGDPGLLQTQLAADHIPGLVDFHKLCQTEGRILPCL